MPGNGFKWVKTLSKIDEPFIKYFSENLMAIETKKTKEKINKPVYLKMSILDTWYDYAN